MGGPVRFSFFVFSRSDSPDLVAVTFHIRHPTSEVIDVRSLAPIDYATIGKSVAKTGRVVSVEEGPKTVGVSGEIAAGLMEHCGESLISPVVRVASADVPVPFTPVLENAYRPDPSRIVAAVRELVRN